ncbi:MAG TPA: BatA domain-containing protein [Sphingobacteriaceae bacterium]
MNFLFPGFLFALIAVVIPVVVHLFNFRKFKKVYFSNVRFLKSVEQQTTAAQKLRDRFILVCRILAILFIVFAFSRPYIPHEAGIAGQSRVVSVYIDNSYSLEAVNKTGLLLDEAKRRAKEIASAYGLNDKFHLVTNDFEGRHQRLVSYDDFTDAVDEVQISGNARNLKQIAGRQEDAFVADPTAARVIFMISDFQRNLLSNERVVIDSTIALRLVRLNANELPNVSVDSVWFTSPVHRRDESEKLVVRLRNNSGEPATNVPIKLTINGQQKALGSLSIAARATSSDTLSFSGLRAGWQEGEITITDYPVTFDDHFYFNFRVYNNLPALAINGSGSNPYLQAVFHSDPFFVVENTSSGTVNYSALSTYPLVILNGVADISPGLAQQLDGYVKKGGSLMIFPSVDDDLAPLRSFLQTLGTDIPEEVIVDDAKVASINLEHPVFEGVFEQIPRNLELPAAKEYVRYSIRSNSSKKSIMDLAGGRTFFAEYPAGEGKVYLSAVPLSEEASNLVNHSVFVPLMYQTALLSRKKQRLFYTLGRDQQFETEKIGVEAGQPLNLSKRGFEAIPEIRQTAGGSAVYVADQIRESGSYRLTRGDSLLALISFNDNRTESDLSYASDDELQAQFPASEVDLLTAEAESSIRNEVAASNFGTDMWKLCIILALVFLAAEALLIRFYRKKQPST